MSKITTKLALGASAAAMAAALLAGCSGTTAGLEDPSSGATTSSVTHHAAKKPHPKYTTGQVQAILSAKNYLQTQGFSKKGLIKQLSSKYGEGFSKADAKFAVNHIKVDWNKQAVRAAKNYLDTMPMSEANLVKQLHSPYGDQFTLAQAEHGASVAYRDRA